MRKFTRIFISILAAATVISGTASAIALETVETIADVVPTTAAFPEAALTADVLDGTFESEQDLAAFMDIGQDDETTADATYEKISFGGGYALKIVPQYADKGTIRIKNLTNPGNGYFVVSCDITAPQGSDDVKIKAFVYDGYKIESFSTATITDGSTQTISGGFNGAEWNTNNLMIWFQTSEKASTFIVDNIAIIPAYYDGTFEALLPDGVVKNGDGGSHEIVSKNGNNVLKVTRNGAGGTFYVNVAGNPENGEFQVSFDLTADANDVTVNVFLYDGDASFKNLQQYITNEKISANQTKTISKNFSASSLSGWDLQNLKVWIQTTDANTFYLDNIIATPIVYNYDGTFDDNIPEGIVEAGSKAIATRVLKDGNWMLQVDDSANGSFKVKPYGDAGNGDFQVSLDIMADTTDITVGLFLYDGDSDYKNLKNFVSGKTISAGQKETISYVFLASSVSGWDLNSLRVWPQISAAGTYYLDNLTVTPVGFDGTFEQVLPSGIIYTPDNEGSYERVPCGDGTYALKVVRTQAEGTFQVKNIGKPSADKDKFVVTFDVGTDTEAVTIKAFLYDGNQTPEQYATIGLQPGEKQTVAHVFSKTDLANWDTDNLILWFQTTEANKTFYLDNILVADYGISTDFEMLNLFQIRENAPSGLRFVSLINCTTADTADSYGFVIARKSQLGDTKLTLTTTTENSDILTIVGRAKETKDGNQIVYDATGASIEHVKAGTNKAITAVITNITDDRKDEVFVVRPFFELDGIAYYGNPVEQSYNGATKNN